MTRYYYKAFIEHFLEETPAKILGVMAQANQFALEGTQRDAWLQQIAILKSALQDRDGTLFFEYSIPRMGKRIDALLVTGSQLIIIEFKIGATQYLSGDIDQVFDYALDLKNFHETSHHVAIVPILVATDAPNTFVSVSTSSQNDGLFFPIRSNKEMLPKVLDAVAAFQEDVFIDPEDWLAGRYKPTPTIIEAAIALYNNHSVVDIARSDAGAKNLFETTQAVSDIIHQARQHHQKAICFVTGVPGAGKTLVGLDIATRHIDKDGESAVFLSGNGPLVAILCEALARDRVAREKENGRFITKGNAKREVKTFIQNIHHFRDEYLEKNATPYEHISIFDEAQRAWNIEQTAAFMKQKRKLENFHISEPEFLISCLDRHQDWAVIICLVGGGQEINTGEGGISEWIHALNKSFPHWFVHISSQLYDSEYAAGQSLQLLSNRMNCVRNNALHLGVSMRSFRAEHLSTFVKAALDIDRDEAIKHLDLIKENYPIVLTRDLTKAKKWLKEKARGSERYGLVVSSQAQRLKPYGIDVRYQIDPVQWFLNDKSDVRSSYYLEDVATEFQVQGLELDWACITWDGDFRFAENDWNTFSFRGNRWERIMKEERKKYLKNAYRVLLTRARQGMVIVVPEGDKDDPTRSPDFYNNTFDYLLSLGLEQFQ